MLDLAILGLLRERELHGYEIRRQLRRTLGLLANVSFGSLYPALARLEAAGAVEATEAVPPPPAAGPTAPPTGSLSGELAVLRARRHSAPRARRSRKVYRITDEGRRTFAELLAGGRPDDARTFDLRLAFARHLAPAARLSLLERRRAALVERLAESAPDGTEGLDPYARSVIEHTAESLAADIAWLDRLIEAERNAGAAGGSAPTPTPTPTPATPTGSTPPTPTAAVAAVGAGPSDPRSAAEGSTDREEHR